VPLVPVELSLVTVRLQEFATQALLELSMVMAEGILMLPEVNPLVPEIAAPVLSSWVVLEFPLFVIHTEPVASAAIELGAFRPPP
jgi:hypothetical protein